MPGSSCNVADNCARRCVENHAELADYISAYSVLFQGREPVSGSFCLKNNCKATLSLYTAVVGENS